METPTSAMDMLVDAQPSAQRVRIKPVPYIPMEDWMKEQDRLDSEKALLPKENQPPPAKKQKQSNPGLDLESVTLEGEVVKALGDKNWVGLLQLYSDAHPGRKLKYDWIDLKTPIAKFRCFVTIQGFTEQFGIFQYPDNDPQNVIFSTKMLAKQYASKLAVDWLIANEQMPSDGTVKFAVPKIPSVPPSELESEQNALQILGDENWVGRLQQYCQAHRKSLPDYKEHLIGPAGSPRFQYTIGNSSELFGCIGLNDEQIVSFSTKKSAKQYAAKKAIDWLIEEKYMPADGAVTFPKPAQLVQPQQAVTPSATSATSAASPQTKSYTAQVPDLCYRLSFPPPSYRLTPAAAIPNCPLWDGYADFNGHPRIGDEGKVGHVENIVGKKNAKEAIARQVYQFLKGVEEDRLKQYEEEDRKRKRSPSSSQTEEVSGATIKVEA